MVNPLHTLHCFTEKGTLPRVFIIVVVRLLWHEFYHIYLYKVKEISGNNFNFIPLYKKTMKAPFLVLHMIDILPAGCSCRLWISTFYVMVQDSSKGLFNVITERVVTKPHRKY